MSRNRWLKGVGIVAAVATIGSLSATTAGQQSAQSRRTPWGDPDLQGTWSYGVLTPLERPAQLAGKEFLTADEAATVNEENALLKDRPSAQETPVRTTSSGWTSGQST